MATQESIQAVIDTKAAEVLAAYNIAFDNTKRDEFSKLQVPFIEVKVNFLSQNQFELGRPEHARTRGTVFFIVYVREGTGVASKNTIQQLLCSAFRSKVIGTATFLNARMVGLGEKSGWAQTGIEFPFHYQETV